MWTNIYKIYFASHFTINSFSFVLNANGHWFIFSRQGQLCHISWLIHMHLPLKRHFNWELSHPSSPPGLVKNFICLLELISACLSPAGEVWVVQLNSSFQREYCSSLFRLFPPSNFSFNYKKKIHSLKWKKIINNNNNNSIVIFPKEFFKPFFPINNDEAKVDIKNTENEILLFIGRWMTKGTGKKNV